MEKSTGTSLNIWPGIVIFIGLAFLAVTGWSIYRANIGVSPLTDPEYYSHGLKYNESNIELKAAEASGWTLATTLSGHELQAAVRDHDGHPVTGCSGRLVIYFHDSMARRVEQTFTETRPGTYATSLPSDLKGSLTGDLSIHRDGARINRRLIISI